MANHTKACDCPQIPRLVDPVADNASEAEHLRHTRNELVEHHKGLQLLRFEMQRIKAQQGAADAQAEVDWIIDLYNQALNGIEHGIGHIHMHFVAQRDAEAMDD